MKGSRGLTRHECFMSIVSFNSTTTPCSSGVVVELNEGYFTKG